MSADEFAGTMQQIRLRDGRLLALAEYGDPAGKPVFFFQGTPSSRLLHPDEAITLELGVRLLSLDRPGFGWSSFQPGRTLLDWPGDIVQVADLLGLDRFAVVGVSGGGPYVAACAYKIPERLTATGMVGSMGPALPELMHGMPYARRAGAAIGRHAPWLLRPMIWLLQNPNRDLEGFVARYTAHNLAPDRKLLSEPGFLDMLKASYAEAARQGIRGFAWEVRLVSRPWGFGLHDIRFKVRLWHGEQDTSTPVSMAQYLANTIPNSRLSVFPNEGHFLIFTHWREILADLLV